MNDAWLILATALLFSGIVLIVVGTANYVANRRVMARRLTIRHFAPALPTPIRVTLEDGFLKRFEKVVTPSAEDERSKIRMRLIQAGYKRPSAVRIYYASKAALALGLGSLAAVMLLFVFWRLPPLIMIAVVVTPALVGNLLPSLWVERQLQRRRQAAEQDFPDVLDMLLVCVEAGLGVDQACRRVSERISKTAPVLAGELKAVNDELSAGKERAIVFHDFSERLGVSDIRAFTTVLRQADEFGVSVAETLRVYAAEMRHKRLMRAEEKANLMPVKVAMGSILFTVPPTMLIMAGPSLIMLMRTFAKL